MSEQGIDRRNFLRCCASILVAPLLQAFRKERPWRTRLAGPKEPGTRLIVSGTIYEPDGITHAQGVKMFLYQTDAAGWYARPVNNPRDARLHATLWTDARGRYEFLTVEPGHYADTRRPPARHIHVHLDPPDLPDHWVDSFKFENDPSLTDEDIRKNSALGAFSAIMRLSGDKDGTLRARRDFCIDPKLAERNRLVNGWYRE